MIKNNSHRHYWCLCEYIHIALCKSSRFVSRDLVWRKWNVVKKGKDNYCYNQRPNEDFKNTWRSRAIIVPDLIGVVRIIFRMVSVHNGVPAGGVQLME